MTRRFLEQVREANTVGQAGNLLAFYGEDAVTKEMYWRDAAQIDPHLAYLLRGEHRQAVRAVLARGACNLYEEPLRPWNQLSPAREAMPWPPERVCPLRFDPDRCRILNSNTGGRKLWRLIAFVGDGTSDHVGTNLQDRWLIADYNASPDCRVVTLMKTAVGYSVVGMTFQYSDDKKRVVQTRFKDESPLLRPYVVVVNRRERAHVLRVPFN